MLPRLAPTLALAVLFPSVVSAQVQPAAETVPGEQVAQYDPPAYVATVDGAATLERDGRIEASALNMPLLSGDRLRTMDGRVEVRFADGGRLYLDARTSVDFLSDELIRLLDGRVRVAEVRTQQVSYRIDSLAGSARILQPGEYRVALLRGESDTQLELAVVRGAGEIFTDSGSTLVRAGERAYASAGLVPSYAYTFNSASGDDFDRWIDLQSGTVYAAASASAQYLPSEMDGYASTFDQYGDWRYQQAYGYVWYPRVAADWRPYYYGRWVSYPRYGWTWIASDRFGWPTHHYGRWGFSAGVWFWIPSSRWAPAYVSWGYANDYVSWCPLGWNNRPVFSINIFSGSGYYYAGPRYYSAWTIVPRGYFGRGYVYERAVSWDRFRNERPRFSEGRAPAGYDRAVPRNSVPIRYAGTRAATGGDRLPAGSANPRYVNRGDQIVRSQTARPVAPRDTAVPRAAPNSTPASREGRAWDDPAYRPPNYNPTSPRSGAYQRTMPQSTPAVRGFERPGERAVPGFQTAPGARPFERGYERTMPRETGPTDPRAVERVSPRQGGAYQRPDAGVYQRPGGEYQPRGEGAYPRQSERPGGGAFQRPGGYDRPVERSATSSRPSSGYERPAERSAPPQRSGGDRPGGGDRAVPRAGGGHANAPAGNSASRGGRGSR